MTTTAALARLREAAAKGEGILFYDENPHWSFGYYPERKKFWWAYECGCDSEFCDADSEEEYDSVEELIEGNAWRLKDMPDYDGWRANA